MNGGGGELPHLPAGRLAAPRLHSGCTSLKQTLGRKAEGGGAERGAGGGSAEGGLEPSQAPGGRGRGDFQPRRFAVSLLFCFRSGLFSGKPGSNFSFAPAIIQLDGLSFPFHTP